MTTLAKWSSVYLTTPQKSMMTYITRTTVVYHIHSQFQGYYHFSSALVFPVFYYWLLSLFYCCWLALYNISNQQQQGWWLAPNHFPWVLLPPPLAPSPSHYYIQNEQAFYYFLSNNQGNCLASQKYRSPPLRGFYNGGIGKALLLYLLSRRSEGLTLAFDAKLI